MVFLKVDLDDKTGHLFVVNIEIDKVRVDAKNLVYKKLHTLIFEKDKVLDAVERSIHQLFEALRKGSDGNYCLSNTPKKLMPPCWKKSSSHFILNI